MSLELLATDVYIASKLTLPAQGKNLCDIGHKYSAFELKLCVLVSRLSLLVFLVPFLLLSAHELVFGLIWVHFLAAEEDPLKQIDRVLYIVRKELFKAHTPTWNADNDRKRSNK